MALLDEPRARVRMREETERTVPAAEDDEDEDEAGRIIVAVRPLGWSDLMDGSGIFVPITTCNLPRRPHRRPKTRQAATSSERRLLVVVEYSEAASVTGAKRRHKPPALQRALTWTE